ncbi:MAG: bifunctional tetrahydrofolate synthase/dihydrofolate synthase [Methylococcales bacterium]|nr:bifunctional tetrahydrofolate synthase/dihydrofolate synthase [Methylococcales bacterium]
MARFNSLEEWLEWQEKVHSREIDLGLEKSAAVFKALNSNAIKPPTIIVAGTNGKGSCIAFLESIYRAQGYRVGAYTSPHILKYNERIRIDGESVSNDKICQAFERIDAIRNDVSLSYFEFGTLAALDIFWRSNLDIQLLEIGLGGRLDAVNIIDADTVLITSVSIDHVDWLGETREAIGYEKAGVFRPGIPAVIGDLDPPKSILKSAIEKKSSLRIINKNFGFKRNEIGWDWFCNTDKHRKYLSLPEPALKGNHQYQNASTALMAIVEMEKHLLVNEAAVHQGLQDVQIQGRFQLIDGDIPVLLDVAHNPHAVRLLFDYLSQMYSDRKIHAVFSMMKDKDIKGVIGIINPAIYHWYISPLKTPRAVNQSDMQDCFEQCSISNVTLGYKSFSESYLAAEENAVVGDLIVVFGSFLLVSEYLLFGAQRQIILEG